MAELHRLERILFRALQSGAKSFKELEDETNLPESSISRAALWLASKGFVDVRELRRTIISIGSEGERFIRLGLPERILAESLLKKHSMRLSEIEVASGLTKEELTLAIGWARRKGWIEVTREDDITVISACSHPEKGIDELLLERLDKGAVVLSQLPPLLRDQVSKL